MLIDISIAIFYNLHFIIHTCSTHISKHVAENLENEKRQPFNI